MDAALPYLRQGVAFLQAYNPLLALSWWQLLLATVGVCGVGFLVFLANDRMEADGPSRAARLWRALWTIVALVATLAFLHAFLELLFRERDALRSVSGWIVGLGGGEKITWKHASFWKLFGILAGCLVGAVVVCAGLQFLRCYIVKNDPLSAAGRSLKWSLTAGGVAGIMMCVATLFNEDQAHLFLSQPFPMEAPTLLSLTQALLFWTFLFLLVFFVFYAVKSVLRHGVFAPLQLAADLAVFWATVLFTVLVLPVAIVAVIGVLVLVSSASGSSAPSKASGETSWGEKRNEYYTNRAREGSAASARRERERAAERLRMESAGYKQGWFGGWDKKPKDD